MIKLLEKELLIKVRKEDLAITREMLKECENEFEEIMTRETNEEYKTKLTIIEGEYLTAEEGGECGGVILYNTNKRITCPNTL